MKRRATSRTQLAGINAAFRARESERSPGERILTDPWAHLFVERTIRVQALRIARLAIPSLREMVDELQTAHCVRHRSIDELILRAVERGHEQVVILGAGYDMRASRFADRVARVRFFEVDHPATIERKWKRLRGRADVNRGVQSIAVDLVEQSLMESLGATGFDASRPACFVLEGLVHYLPLAVVETLLGQLGSGRREMILSFIRTEMYRSASRLFVRLVQILREVPTLHFSPEELSALCARHGFGEFQSWSFEEQIEAFAPEAKGRRASLSQDVARIESAPSGLVCDSKSHLRRARLRTRE